MLPAHLHTVWPILPHPEMTPSCLAPALPRPSRSGLKSTGLKSLVETYGNPTIAGSMTARPALLLYTNLPAAASAQCWTCTRNLCHPSSTLNIVPIFLLLGWSYFSCCILFCNHEVWLLIMGIFIFVQNFYLYNYFRSLGVLSKHRVEI